MKIQYLLLIKLLLLCAFVQAQEVSYWNYESPFDYSRLDHLIENQEDEGHFFNISNTLYRTDSEGVESWNITIDFLADINESIRGIYQLESGNLGVLTRTYDDGEHGMTISHISYEGELVDHFYSTEDKIYGNYLVKDQNDFFYYIHENDDAIVKIDSELNIMWKVEVENWNDLTIDDSGSLLVHTYDGGTLEINEVSKEDGSILDNIYTSSIPNFNKTFKANNENWIFKVQPGTNPNVNLNLTIYDDNFNFQHSKQYVINSSQPIYPGNYYSSSASVKAYYELPNGSVALIIKWSFFYLISGNDVGSTISTNRLVLLDEDGELIINYDLNQNYDFNISFTYSIATDGSAYLLLGGNMDDVGAAIMRVNLSELNICDCPSYIDPVCGSDGNVYNNSCYAECSDIVYYDNGESCNAEYLEVICEGGSIVLPPPGQFCPGCFCQWMDEDATVSVYPFAGVNSYSFEDGISFSPAETTLYTVTTYWPSSMPGCSPTSNSYNYLIFVDSNLDCEEEPEEPEENTNAIDLPDYPWLSDELPNTENVSCDDYVQIIEYQSGPYSYLFIEAGSDGTSVLYNEYGQLYCSNINNYDCVAAYGFTDGTVLWTCSDENIPNECDCPNEGEVVCGSDNVVYDNSCEAECAGVTWTLGDCQEEEPNNPINTPYTWLNELLTNPDCCQVSEAYSYQAGPYTYIFVAADESGDCGVGILYNEEGQLYCTSQTNFDCVSLYGLTNQSLLWSCDEEGNNNPPSNTGECNYEHNGTVFFDYCDGELYYLIELDNGDIVDPYLPDDLFFNFIGGAKVSFSYTLADFESPCLFEATAVDLVCIQEDIEPSELSDYPWLDDMIDNNNCCETNEIYEYSNGLYSYIFVYSEAACGSYPSMYNEDGLFYCQSAEGFNCIELYELTDWTITPLYTCAGKSFEDVSHKEDTGLDLEAYPNPSNGVFFLKYTETEPNTKVNVFDLRGHLVFSQQASNQIDLTHLAKGVYILELTNNKQGEVKKLIIE